MWDMPKTNRTKEMCAICGETFLAGPYAQICPKCHRWRVEEGLRKSRERKKEKTDETQRQNK